MRASTVLFTFAAIAGMASGSPVAAESSAATTTTSSSAPCPTQPEAGTYCGFINPEDPCAPQPGGQGPTISPDTVDAFMAYPAFESMSSNATTPGGYTNIFKGLNASANASPEYLGFYLLDSYDTAACAAHCDSTENCTSFNLYIERDPSQNPSANDSTAPTVWGYWCPNPAAIVNYKCALWSSKIDLCSMVNQGEWRHEFQVAITASNGYVNSAAAGNVSYVATNTTSCIGSTVSKSGSSSSTSSNSSASYTPMAFTGAGQKLDALSWLTSGALVLGAVAMFW
ncbi:hypothetical protein MBLNU459_g5572t1 [Dothideomycetes sp. NU459]